MPTLVYCCYDMSSMYHDPSKKHEYESCNQAHHVHSLYEQRSIGHSKQTFNDPNFDHHDFVAIDNSQRIHNDDFLKIPSTTIEKTVPMIDELFCGWCDTTLNINETFATNSDSLHDTSRLAILSGAKVVLEETFSKDKYEESDDPNQKVLECNSVAFDFDYNSIPCAAFLCYEFLKSEGMAEMPTI